MNPQPTPASPHPTAERKGITRRHVIKSAVGLGVVSTLPGCSTISTPHDPASVHAIHRENARPGTRDWLLTKTRIDAKTKYRSPWIEGYCSRATVKAGEEISFHVSTNPSSSFTLDVFRMGYYGGTGGRQVASFGPFKGVVQPDPPVGPKRLRECDWDPCHTLKVPRDWLSGVYLGKLTEQREGLQSYVIFVVRDDRRADFIFQVSDNTWQAYNRWPSQFSLYDNGQSVWYWGNNVDISYNRPYGLYCQIYNEPLLPG